MRVLMISALLYAAGAIQTPAAPVYDVAFVLSEGSYTGTTTFTVGRGGEVTGTMKLTSPTVVDAELKGAVKDGTWTFEFTYTIPEQSCTGTVKGTGKVAADRSTVKGEVVIGGPCVEAPTEAQFTFTRQK